MNITQWTKRQAPAATPEHSPHRVVIVGGGFGGLQAALKLARGPVEVTLVDRRNFHLFQPLAYQVATGGPLTRRDLLPASRGLSQSRQRPGPARGGHRVRSRISASRAARGGAPHAGWRATRVRQPDRRRRGALQLLGHDSWPPHAPELKSLEGALDIRGRILSALEAAEWEADRELQRAWLTFVVVGGGPTGVEMAGQIAEIARDTRRDFDLADSAVARVLLVQAGERVLPGFPRSLSVRAACALERLGVTPLLDHTVTEIEDGAVTVRTPDGGLEEHAARTVIWAAGVAPSSLAGALAQAGGGELDRGGRLVVEPDLTMAGHPEVVALGDMVAIRREGRVQTLPGLAPVAMQQGRHAARVVLANLRGGQPSSFRYHDKGNLATIGRARAVADLRVVRLSGAPAWITWLAVHLFYMIGVQNRLLVLTQWALCFFTRGRGARLISGPAANPAPVEAARGAA